MSLFCNEDKADYRIVWTGRLKECLEDLEAAQRCIQDLCHSELPMDYPALFPELIKVCLDSVDFEVIYQLVSEKEDADGIAQVVQRVREKCIREYQAALGDKVKSIKKQ